MAKSAKDKAAEAEAAAAEAEAEEPVKEVEAVVASTVRPKLSDLVRQARDGHEHRKSEALKDIKK